MSVSHSVELRSCRTCKEAKPRSAFYNDSRYKDGDTRCSECRKAKVNGWRSQNIEKAKAIQRRSREKHGDQCRDRARKWHADNRERHLAYMANRRERFPDRIKTSALKSAFGITLDDYSTLLAKQGGVCAICGRTPEQNKKRLAVDHCHATKKVRGLLCSPCNQGIGLFKDDPEILNSAISYLNQQPK